METASEASLVTMSEIAAMAQVKRPVVSNWRRRHLDFPAPVVGDPMRFPGVQVVEWLTATGLGNADPAELQAELALHNVVTLARLHSPRALVEITGSLLCLRHLDDKPLAPAHLDEPVEDTVWWAALLARAERMDPDDEFVLTELRSADASAVGLARWAEALVEAAYTTGGAYEWLLAARDRLGLTDLTLDAIIPELQQLIVEVGDPISRVARTGRVVVADPQAGAGDLLVSVAHAVDEPCQVVALAAEPTSWLARVARRRLLLAGIPEVGLDVQTGGDLEERLADPDLLVTQLPYQAGETRSRRAALEAIEQFGDLLGPGSTAVVLGPAEGLVDRLPDRTEARLRADLLRSGLVEAVVNLPGGALPARPGYRCGLWVLTRDPIKAARGYVLLADVSAEPLDGGVRARLAQDLLLWRAEGRRMDGHDPRYGRIVPIADLVRRPSEPLTPSGPPASQLLAQMVTERPALIVEAESRVERTLGELVHDTTVHGHLRTLIVRREDARPARVTVGQLIADRRLTKLRGHRLTAEHLAADGRHRVLGPPEVRGTTPVGVRRIDRAVLAAEYEHAALTEPGDIVYVMAPRLTLLIDHDGFSVAAFPARVLRVCPTAERPLAPRVLAALLGAARNTARSPSAVRAAQRIEDVTIPDLDPAEVERFDAVLADLDRRRELLRAQDAALAETYRLAVAGIADGTLTIDRP